MKSEQFKEKVLKKFGNIFSFEKMNYLNAKTKVKLICLKCDNEFEVMPSNLISQNKGCPFCNKRIASNKGTTEEFIEKARKVHGDKYDYSFVDYKGSNEKICISCSIHGKFFKLPRKFLAGQGCQECSKEKNSLKYSKDEFLQSCSSRRNDLDNYDFSEFVYVDYFTKSKIKCRQHNQFFSSSPMMFIRGQECPSCYQEKNKQKRISLVVESLKKHGFELLEKQKFQKTKQKLKVKCLKCNSEFQAPLDHLLNGQRCLICAERYSKGESEISQILKNYGIEYEEQKSFPECKDKKLLSFDFYLPDYNVLIEYDGIQHFKPIEFFGGMKQFLYMKKHDEIKNCFAKDQNIELLRISYNENLNEKLTVFLKSLKKEN